MRSAILSGLLLLIAANPAAADSAASQLLYERTVMGAAGARCGLFAPQVAGALEAARVQARGAALRAGDSEASLSAVEARARAKAASADCRSKGLQTAGDRVRGAFADYARLYVMRFPGPASAWRAERPNALQKGARWSLVQALPGTGGWVLFGSLGGRPALLDARRGAAPAAGARILLRDRAKLDRPYIPGPPPEAEARVYLASSRRVLTDHASLPAGARSGVLYSFPPELMGALAALDPREMAKAQLVYPSRGADKVVSAPIEVGDLAAARAFLSIPVATGR